MKLSQILLLIFFVFIVGAFWFLDAQQFLSLTFLKSQLGTYQEFVAANLLEAIGIFGLIYIVCAAFSFPGATLLTLLAGALFGNLLGTVIVSFASTIGATLAFLSARFLFYEKFQNKFKNKLAVINRGVEREGASYLLTLRLLPIFPFFIVNLVMGLTPIALRKFYLFSQIGMLPATFIYVNAGRELSKIESLSGLISPSVFISLVLLGLFPLIMNFAMNAYKSKKLYSRFKKPKKFDYNMIVLGAGSAGLVTAYIASAVKAKVALIEKDKMGGDCLNTGCVPSKAIIRSARFMKEAADSKKLGIESAQVRMNFVDVIGRVQETIRKIEPHDSVQRYTDLGVDCISGDAKVISPFAVQVNGKTITARNLIIATGARPRVIPFAGLESVGHLTSETLWNLKELPKRLLVVGGGAIGCELAQAFQFLGSQVFLLEAGQRLMSKEDLDVSQLMERTFRSNGMQIFKSAKIQRFEKSAGGMKKVVFESPDTGAQDLEFDEVLLALGRDARIEGFGLEELGIEVSKTIVTDAFLRTNYPNIFACGDVVGPFQFTHVAAHQAWHASVNALFSPFKKFAADYRVIPWATYTTPEVARVGLSEDEASAAGVKFDLTTYPIDDLDRAIADSKDHGFVKVLTKPGSDQILGVIIVAHGAADMLQEFVLAMKYKLGLNKILGTIHPYPTMSEANKYVAGAWKKKNAPEWALKLLEKFHRRRRG